MRYHPTFVNDSNILNNVKVSLPPPVWVNKHGYGLQGYKDPNQLDSMMKEYSDIMPPAGKKIDIRVPYNAAKKSGYFMY